MTLYFITSLDGKRVMTDPGRRSGEGKRMAKYRIINDVDRAKGTQCWLVDANDEAEALRLFKDGKADFEFEEIEVIDVGGARVELVDDIEEDQEPDAKEGA